MTYGIENVIISKKQTYFLYSEFFMTYEFRWFICNWNENHIRFEIMKQGRNWHKRTTEKKLLSFK